MNVAAFLFLLFFCAGRIIASEEAAKPTSTTNPTRHQWCWWSSARPAFLAGKRTKIEKQKEAAEVLSFRYGKDRPASSSSPRRANFSWQASVERLTGKANSLERSNVPTHSKLAKTVAIIRAENSSDDTIDLLTLASDLFGVYPLWLCRFPITLGLLQAVPAGRGGYQIRARPFGIQILSFGAPRSHSILFKNEQEKGTDCTVVLPITGGILSLPGPRGDRGSLQFALQTTTTTTTTTITTTTAQYLNDDVTAEHDAPPSTTQQPTTTCRIVTAISGYRPALCGSNTPISTFRAGFYLRSQSIFHGYIMWKFHRHCRGYERVRTRATRQLL